MSDLFGEIEGFLREKRTRPEPLKPDENIADIYHQAIESMVDEIVAAAVNSKPHKQSFEWTLDITQHLSKALEYGGSLGIEQKTVVQDINLECERRGLPIRIKPIEH